MNLFDAAEGERRRDVALAQVELNADDRWMEAAEAAVRFCARTMDDFTSDDVWARLSGVPAPHEPRAMGAVMRRLAKDGVVVRTDRTRDSERPEAHRGPKRVWVAG